MTVSEVYALSQVEFLSKLAAEFSETNTPASRAIAARLWGIADQIEYPDEDYEH